MSDSASTASSSSAKSRMVWVWLFGGISLPAVALVMVILLSVMAVLATDFVTQPAAAANPCAPAAGAASPGSGSVRYPMRAGTYTLSSPYGPRGGGFHRGQDFAAPLGTPIYAAVDGTVEKAGPASGFGNWIVLKSAVAGQTIGTVYGHMATSGVLVKEGQTVTAGQQIAAVGSEGESTGPHLHFEVWSGGRFGGQSTDPIAWLGGQHADPATAGGTQLVAAQSPSPGGTATSSGSGSGGAALPAPGPNVQQAAGGAKAGPIPVTMQALYQKAGQASGVPWTVLAGIGWEETRHGVNTNTSSAGAQGPMQFMPSTWAAYGVDGDGDGVKDIRNPADAVPAAAEYLVANGAGNGPAGITKAIFGYNHADWYVNDVLTWAQQYGGGTVTASAGCADTAADLGGGGASAPGSVIPPGLATKTDWAAEAATADDPTTTHNITPRMLAVYQALQTAGYIVGGASCWDPHPQNPSSDHPLGKACDVFFAYPDTAQIAKGWGAANYLVAHQAQLGIKYLIWQGQFWSAAAPATWTQYSSPIYGCPNPKQITGCHYDHVHVSVY